MNKRIKKKKYNKWSRTRSILRNIRLHSRVLEELTQQQY